MHTNGQGPPISSRRTWRLLRHLDVLGRLMKDDRPPAEERLVALIGEDQLRLVREQVDAVPAAAACSRPRAYTRAIRRLSRLKSWQLSVFFFALGCGAAIAIVCLIDLLWRVRGLVGGLGAVVIVVAVYQQTRHHRVEESWIGS